MPHWFLFVLTTAWIALKCHPVAKHTESESRAKKQQMSMWQQLAGRSLTKRNACGIPFTDVLVVSCRSCCRRRSRSGLEVLDDDVDEQGIHCRMIIAQTG
jgi:hypothetical protein